MLDTPMVRKSEVYYSIGSSKVASEVPRHLAYGRKVFRDLSPFPNMEPLYCSTIQYGERQISHDGPENAMFSGLGVNVLAK